MKDFSQDYTNYKNSKILIARNSQVISFKPFIEEISYERSVEIKNLETVYGPIAFFGDAKASNKLSFKVVSTGYEEAKVNHQKFQKLMRMIMPPFLLNSSDEALISRIHIKFANLIHSEASTAFNSESYELIKLTGMEFDIDGIEYKPDLDMGFYDDHGIILAKTFDISLSLEVTNPSKTSRKIKKSERRDENEPGKLFGFPVPWRT